MLGRHMSEDMEFPALADMARDFGPDFFGIGEWIPSMADLQALGVSGLAGGGGILLTANVLERITFLADKPNAKAGSAIAIGLLGGYALSKASLQAGCGFAGGVAGMGIAKLIANLASVPGGLSSAEVTTTPSYEYFSPSRGALRGGVEKAFARDIVSEDDPYALSSAEVVEDADSLGSWIGG